jgi:pyruvate/2-oxoacid:ferredoxin oxidoreductase beta subunit
MTSPYGRKAEVEGYPMKVAELISSLEAPAYVERVALSDAKNILNARRAVRKAIQTQIDGKGFSLVEALSQCPSGWKMTPVDGKNSSDENG